MTRFDEHDAPPSPPVDAFKEVREASAIWNSHLYRYVAPDGRWFNADGTEDREHTTSVAACPNFKKLTPSALAEISERAEDVGALAAKREAADEAARFKRDLDMKALNAVAPVAPVGKKHDGGKARYDLMPPQTLSEVVAVLTFGAKKYGDENWREVPDALRRYYAAAMRHIEAFRRGEMLDPETGEPHLAHAICCLTFLNEMFR